MPCAAGLAPAGARKLAAQGGKHAWSCPAARRRRAGRYCVTMPGAEVAFVTAGGCQRPVSTSDLGA